MDIYYRYASAHVGARNTHIYICIFPASSRSLPSAPPELFASPQVAAAAVWSGAFTEEDQRVPRLAQPAVQAPVSSQGEIISREYLYLLEMDHEQVGE